MLDTIKRLLLSHQIDCFGALPLSECELIRPDKLKRHGFDPNGELSVIMLAIPYYTDCPDKNISSYAIPRDYHLYFEQLSNALIAELSEIFKGHIFACFADNSPINERNAAAKAGIGIIGRNGLLITQKYSSYVFLGEIITDLPLKTEVPYEINYCVNCGKCISACPMSDIGECLSALTQKKGVLTDAESAQIAKYGSAWGCDICQTVCPHTQKAIREGTIYTPIQFFKEDLTSRLTCDIIDKMSNEEFAQRAYSWRKRETIKRNLKIIESDGDLEKGGNIC